MMKKTAMIAGAVLLIGGTAAYAQTSSTQPMKESLSQVSNLSTLNNDAVQDQSGNTIGTVHKVVKDSYGNPQAVQVDAKTSSGTKTVSIQASQIKYEPNKNALSTTMTKNQITSLPKVSGS